MATTICVLNLSNPAERFAPDLGANSPIEINSPDAVPQDDSLILYIVGHGLQNRLISSNGTVLSEKKVAEAIRGRRDQKPTLIIWDVCFSKSLLKIPELDDWAPNFVHIFSSQAFERTWHLKRPTDGTPALTLFSIELRKAVAKVYQAQPNFRWVNLRDQLQPQLQPIQAPEIVPLESDYQPGAFQLGTLLGAAP